MSVFLRWGIFGIIGFAALMYAYNASKRMSEKHTRREPPAVVATDARTADVTPAPERQPEPVSAYAPPPHCQAELAVAQRALEARRQGEPIDRLLRIQEIAFQEGARRQRLEKVATRWYQLQGDEPIPEALSIAVISDCVRFSPAP
jgi:hypothetical protein